MSHKLNLDNCVEKLSKRFTTSAKTTFGIKRSRNIREKTSKVRVSKKLWFRLDCKYARQNYRNNYKKSRYKRNKTESSKLEMKKAEKGA